MVFAGKAGSNSAQPKEAVVGVLKSDKPSKNVESRSGVCGEHAHVYVDTAHACVFRSLSMLLRVCFDHRVQKWFRTGKILAE